MAAQDGQCPTCGNNITIPILDRYGRLIDPKTRQIISRIPTPCMPTRRRANGRRAYFGGRIRSSSSMSEVQ